MKSSGGPIDIVKVISEWTPDDWNKLLTKLHRKKDINGLVDLMIRLQEGMDKAAKSGFNTDIICETFLRMQRSIELTLKKIYRKKYPNQLYNPLATNIQPGQIKDKKTLDHNFELFLRKHRY